MPAGRSPRLSWLWSSSRVFSCANSSLTFAFLTEMSQQLMDALSQYLVHVLLRMKCYNFHHHDNLCDGLSGVYPISCNISWHRLQLTFLFCVPVCHILDLIISTDKKKSLVLYFCHCCPSVFSTSSQSSVSCLQWHKHIQSIRTVTAQYDMVW